MSPRTTQARGTATQNATHTNVGARFEAVSAVPASALTTTTAVSATPSTAAAGSSQRGRANAGRPPSASRRGRGHRSPRGGGDAGPPPERLQTRARPQDAERDERDDQDGGRAPGRTASRGSAGRS